MTQTKPKFPFSTNLYLGVIAAFIILLPVEIELIRSKTASISISNWLIAALAVFTTVALLFYAKLRCTSEKLSYIQGLQFVTTFMQGAGLMYITMILIFLSLCAIMPASIALSVYGDLTRTNRRTPVRYHKLVLLFHKHRARQ